MQTTIKERDAMLLTTIRKNPAIALSVTAISFKNYLNEDDYSTAFGLVFVNAMLLDWCTFPFIAILRKLRLGYIINKKQESSLPEVLNVEEKSGSNNSDASEEIVVEVKDEVVVNSP